MPIQERPQLQWKILTRKTIAESLEREQKDNTHVELAGKNFKVVILTSFKNKGKIILQEIK